jgi:hypothetical protein
MNNQTKNNISSLLANLQDEMAKENPNHALIKRVLFLIWKILGYGLLSFLKEHEISVNNAVEKSRTEFSNNEKHN